jgi:hypothetical protein
MAIRTGTKPIVLEREASWLECDGCAKATEPTEKGRWPGDAPAGWYTLLQLGHNGLEVSRVDVCGRACLQAVVLARYRPEGADA